MTDLTPARRARLKAVAAQRTNHVSVLLDDVHDPHNIAAVLRSADAFGVRDVHVVEQHGRVRISNRVARGTQHWVNLFRYVSAEVAIQQLKKAGFQIWVAAAGDKAKSIHSWSGDEPTVFVFGNEHKGVRKSITDACDQIFEIPMFGMVESLNVSVATAITLNSVRQMLENKKNVGKIDKFHLNEDQQATLMRIWQK